MSSQVTYSLFGVNLATKFPFASNLPLSSRPADITFELVAAPPLSWNRKDRAPAYESPLATESGETILRVYRLGEWEVLAFTNVVDFYFHGSRILAHVAVQEDLLARVLVEIRLLGAAMAYWLERQGLPALHASAVVVDGGAVGFLATNRGGKTSLAASFLDAGHPLLTDDILALEHSGDETLVRSGPPQMRMWPPLATHFLESSMEALPLVHPQLSKRRVDVSGESRWGLHCAESRPLRCLYLPQRSLEGEADQDSSENQSITVERLKPRDAVIELIRHSFLSTLAAGVGWEAKRLVQLSEVVEKVPCYRLMYPSGFDHLDRVRKAILDDLVDCNS